MVMKLAELRKLSKKELENKYDEQTASGGECLSFYRDEIIRREQNKLTKAMVVLTIFIVILTIVQVIATVITLQTI
jgi:hypothetical protein